MTSQILKQLFQRECFPTRNKCQGPTSVGPKVFHNKLPRCRRPARSEVERIALSSQAAQQRFKTDSVGFSKICIDFVFQE